MNSPFPRNPRADFRPRPISANAETTEQEKLRVTRPVERDFRPKAVVDGPKESAPESVTTPAEKVNPAHPAARSDKSKETGESTPPAVKPRTPKSSSPKPPATPSKPSDSA